MNAATRNLIDPGTAAHSAKNAPTVPGLTHTHQEAGVDMPRVDTPEPDDVVTMTYRALMALVSARIADRLNELATHHQVTADNLMADLAARGGPVAADEALIGQKAAWHLAESVTLAALALQERTRGERR